MPFAFRVVIRVAFGAYSPDRCHGESVRVVWSLTDRTLQIPQRASAGDRNRARDDPQEQE